MSDIRFVDQHIEREVPAHLRKLTATRLGAVLGVNPYSSPFRAWCEITKTWKDDFVENRYTRAGKAIEPLVINYLKTHHLMDLKTPTEVYGEDYFTRTRGDFFPSDPVFGGMWDALGPDYVVEVKTTRRSQDWVDEPPMYYRLQAALYCALLGFKTFYLVCAFLQDGDYVEPENFTPTVDNVAVYCYQLDEAFPFFEDNFLEPARAWYHHYCEGGVSPDFDERKDDEVLKDLRTMTVTVTDENIQALMVEADALLDELEGVKPAQNRLKAIEDAVKGYLVEQIGDDCTAVTAEGPGRCWTVSRRAGRASIDTKALKADHPEIYGEYVKVSDPTYTLTKRRVESDKM